MSPATVLRPASASLATGARRRGACRRRRPGRRLEPSRGAVHRVAAAGRRHRLLHVPQLRAGPRRLRHADRELPAAAGPVRRAELLQARSERRLRDPRHQRRQRRRERHVPVPDHQRPARQPAQRRRQDGVDPAGAERLGRRRPAERHRAQHRRELHADRGPRAAPQRRQPAGRDGRAARPTFAKPVDYIGTKTIGDYVAYANRHIHDIAIPGCTGNGRVFVGQRKDPFVVNLGETFDLVNIKYPAVELNPLAEFATEDTLADKNVTSFILEVPIACLTEGKGPIIGGWTSASVPIAAAAVDPAAAGPRPDVPDRRSSCRCRASACRSSTRSSSGSRTRTASTRASRRTTDSSPTTSPIRRCRRCSRSCSAARASRRRRTSRAPTWSPRS